MKKWIEYVIAAFKGLTCGATIGCFISAVTYIFLFNEEKAIAWIWTISAITTGIPLSKKLLKWLYNDKI